MTSVHYAELTPTAFEKRLAAAPIAYLSVGTLEWHGRHLPYGTDMIAPIALFERVAAQVGGIVLPPLFMGVDCHERGEDGSDYYGMDFWCKNYPRQQMIGSAYWMPDALFRDLLRAIAKQLARTGFRILVGDGHWPSRTAFLSLSEEFKKEYGLTCLSGFDDTLPSETIGGHGGPGETSLIMAARPDLVRMEDIPTEGTLVGVSNDAREGASTAVGERMFAAHAESLARRLSALI